MDLSSRNPTSLDLSSVSFNNNSSQPSSPSSPLRSTGLGDLRAISQRGWSRSVDDLGKMSAEPSPEMEDRIAQYRNRSNSNGPPSAPPIVQRNFGSGIQPFPSLTGTETPKPATPTVSISISAPAVDESASIKPQSLPTHVHTRSHSFTPKLASKLSTPRFIPPSPKRKGSASSEMEPSPSSRGAFPFSSSSSRSLLPDSSSTPALSHRSTTLLAPPNIVEPMTLRVQLTQTLFRDRIQQRLYQQVC